MEPQNEKAPVRALRLRCELRENPLGIDARKPRLSWALESAERGMRQTAYRILVAGSAEALAAEDGDLWDSGRVESRETVHIPYQGAPLRSGQRCFWKVRVWDHAGRASDWSETAWWEMGLLERADWKAEWIGVRTLPAGAAEAKAIEEASWIWVVGDEPPRENRTVVFRCDFDLPAGAAPARAPLWITADDAYRLWVNAGEVVPPGEENKNWRLLQEIDIAPRLEPGRWNSLFVAVTNQHSAGGLLAALTVELPGAEPIRVRTGADWRARDAESEDWSPPAAGDAGWGPVEVKAAFGEGEWGRFTETRPAAPCPFLRREFTAGKPVARARLYATARGLYEMHINGARVGADRFTPGWTDYNKRLRYQTYDVTSLVAQGENAIGAVLGDGWYAGALGWSLQRHTYGPYPLGLFCRLELEYADGSKEAVVSGGAWRGSSGPVVASEFLAGETHDARLEMAGWDKSGFDAAGWQPVEILPPGEAVLAAQPCPTVQPVMEIAARAITEPQPRVFVFDLGQNIVGWARLRVLGAEAGEKVRLRFAEMLAPDGMIYTENLRRAACTDTFICRGDQWAEEYEPRFTFHGFRYVELTGYPGEPRLDSVAGIVAHSAMPMAGTFACSDATVNQLQSNIVWGQRGNHVSIPTDCPQRDERLGWMGDAQIFAPTACWNMDMAAFYAKWLQDVVDAQSEAGAFPDVAPRAVTLKDGAPAWGDAGVIVPWTCYLFYADRGLIDQLFEPMRKWVDWIHAANTDLIWKKQTNNNYGDWVAMDDGTPKEVLATAFFANSARLVSLMAAAAGRLDEAAGYADLFEQIKRAFNEAFVDDFGRVMGHTQTCYVLALQFDLLPEDLRPAAVLHLVADIEQRGWHLSTGFVGVGHLLPVLGRFGRTDAAYRLLLCDTYPSWGYSIRQGATTIWERWDGWTEEKGFQTPGMNSFNHYALGSVGAWLYAAVAGIAPDPERPGFERILIEPRPGGGLTSASATYDSIRGTISSSWRIEGDRFVLDVTIPANTTASIRLPVAPDQPARESGKPLEKARGLSDVRREGDAIYFNAASGTYHLTGAR